MASTDGRKFDAFSAPFTESAGTLPDVVCPELPGGVLVDTITVNEVDSKSSHELWTQKMPAEVNQTQQAYPECADSTCLVELVKNGSVPLTTCHQDPEGCVDWFTDPNKTDKYSCTYWGRKVSLDECNTYSNRWKPANIEKGNILSDPKTGEARDAPKGTQPGKGAAAQSPEVGDDRISCLPDGFTLNPIDWVLAPLKCAFSPRPSVVNKALTGLQTTASASMPGRYAAEFASWNLATPQSGCSGIPINLFFTKPFTIMAACPGDTLAPIAYWSRIFGNVAVGVICLMASTRYVAAAFGFTGLGSGKGDDE